MLLLVRDDLVGLCEQQNGEWIQWLEILYIVLGFSDRWRRWNELTLMLSIYFRETANQRKLEDHSELFLRPFEMALQCTAIGILRPGPDSFGISTPRIEMRQLCESSGSQ